MIIKVREWQEYKSQVISNKLSLTTRLKSAVNSLRLLSCWGFAEACSSVPLQFIWSLGFSWKPCKQPLNTFIGFVIEMVFITFRGSGVFLCLKAETSLGRMCYCSWKGAWPSPGPWENSKDQTSLREGGENIQCTDSDLRVWVWHVGLNTCGHLQQHSDIFCFDRGFLKSEPHGK